MKKIACRISPLSAAELRAGAAAATTTTVSPIVRPGLNLDPEPAPGMPVYIPVIVAH